MTVQSASGTPEAANHSRLKAARVIASEKLLAKPCTKNSRFLPLPRMSASVVALNMSGVTSAISSTWRCSSVAGSGVVLLTKATPQDSERPSMPTISGPKASAGGAPAGPGARFVMK